MLGLQSSEKGLISTPNLKHENSNTLAWSHKQGVWRLWLVGGYALPRQPGPWNVQHIGHSEAASEDSLTRSHRLKF